MKTLGYCFILFLLGLSSIASAETMYVSSYIKITLRTGPGTDYKVVQMITSGEEIEMLEQSGDWSEVRMPDGTEGWVLSRFISPAKPSGMLLEALQQKYDKLLDETTFLRNENKNLKSETARLSKELKTATRKLDDTSNSYSKLKNDSSDFIALQSKYQTSAKNLQEQTEKARMMEKQLFEKNIKLFALGAGILFFGFIIGFVAKKQRKRSSLLS